MADIRRPATNLAAILQRMVVGDPPPPRPPEQLVARLLTEEVLPVDALPMDALQDAYDELCGSGVPLRPHRHTAAAAEVPSDASPDRRCP